MNIQFRVQLYNNIEIPVQKLKMLNVLLDELIFRLKDGYTITNIEYWISITICLYILHMELVLNYHDNEITNILTIHFSTVIRITEYMMKSLETQNEEIENESVTKIYDKLIDIHYLFRTKNFQIASSS